MWPWNQRSSFISAWSPVPREHTRARERSEKQSDNTRSAQPPGGKHLTVGRLHDALVQIDRVDDGSGLAAQNGAQFARGPHVGGELVSDQRHEHVALGQTAL